MKFDIVFRKEEYLFCSVFVAFYQLNNSQQLAGWIQYQTTQLRVCRFAQLLWLHRKVIFSTQCILQNFSSQTDNVLRLLPSATSQINNPKFANEKCQQRLVVTTHSMSPRIIQTPLTFKWFLQNWKLTISSNGNAVILTSVSQICSTKSCSACNEKAASNIVPYVGEWEYTSHLVRPTEDQYGHQLY